MIEQKDFQKTLKNLAFVELVYLYHFFSGITADTEIAQVMQCSRRYIFKIKTSLKSKLKGVLKDECK